VVRFVSPFHYFNASRALVPDHGLDLPSGLALIAMTVTMLGAAASAQQYLSFAAQIVVPMVTAYVLTQAAGWVADLKQGRLELILAGPLSWAALIWQRLLALTFGAAVITAGATCGLVIGPWPSARTLTRSV